MSLRHVPNFVRNSYVHWFSTSFPSIVVACCRWPWQPTPPTTATQRLAANPMRKPFVCRDCPEISAVPSATARAAAQVMCQKVTAPLLSVLSEPPRVTSTALWFASLTLTAVSELHEDVLVFRWLQTWNVYNLVWLLKACLMLCMSVNFKTYRAIIEISSSVPGWKGTWMKIMKTRINQQSKTWIAVFWEFVSMCFTEMLSMCCLIFAKLSLVLPASSDRQHQVLDLARRSWELVSAPMTPPTRLMWKPWCPRPVFWRVVVDNTGWNVELYNVY